MVDEKNTILMTKLAIFEKKEKNKSLVMSKYYKTDYVRFNVLKTWVAATVLYWSIVGGYVFMAFDVLLAKINDLDYFGIMYKLLGGYVAVCAIYFLFASILYSYRYNKAKPGLIDYNVNLKKLIGIDNDTQRGHLVSEHTSNVMAGASSSAQNARDGARNQDQQVGAQMERQNRGTVRRTDMIQRQLNEEQERKNAEIRANVQRRNERLAAQNEAQLRQQRQMEEEKRRIRENRQRLEREQMERLRQQRMQQGGVNRENHMYQPGPQSNSGRSEN